MQIIGHRGARGLAKENSLAAIQEALKHKVDYIELDVRMQNNVLVLSHDETMHYESYTTLEDALKKINGKAPVYLELKESEVISHLPELIKNYTGKVMFASFKFHILRELKKILPEAEFAVIEKWSALRAVAEASLLQTKKIVLNHKWLWAGVIGSLKDQGFEVYAYTVNDVERAQELASWGVDGICTDYPNRFV